MKIKDLKYTYKTDRSTRVYGTDIVTPYGAGREAVHRIESIRRPVRVSAAGGMLTISDVGYTWYQLALRERYFWLSAAFDDGGELIELYFDITGGNDFSDPENPRFRDLYLDIAVAGASGSWTNTSWSRRWRRATSRRRSMTAPWPTARRCGYGWKRIGGRRSPFAGSGRMRSAAACKPHLRKIGINSPFFSQDRGKGVDFA